MGTSSSSHIVGKLQVEYSGDVPDWSVGRVDGTYVDLLEQLRLVEGCNVRITIKVECPLCGKFVAAPGGTLGAHNSGTVHMSWSTCKGSGRRVGT